MPEAVQSPKPAIETTETQGQGSIFSPEGALMLTVAVLIDLGGLVEFIPAIGSILSYGVDFLGLVFIGGWMLFRSQTVTVTGRAATRVGKVAKWAKRMKWLRPLCFILEFIPIVGILPLWTLVVYFELKQ